MTMEKTWKNIARLWQSDYLAKYLQHLANFCYSSIRPPLPSVWAILECGGNIEKPNRSYFNANISDLRARMVEELLNLLISFILK